jgi:hypothetical protein
LSARWPRLSRLNLSRSLRYSPAWGSGSFCAGVFSRGLFAGRSHTALPVQQR